MMKIKLGLLLLWSLLVMAIYAQDIQLADEGILKVEVIKPETGSSSNAALLAGYLVQILNPEATLTLGTVPNSAIPVSIHVGETRYVKDLIQITPELNQFSDEDEYLIKTEMDSSTKLHIIILGGNDLAISYGVTSFLEDYLHVRWLLPSQDGSGEYVPSMPDAKIDFPYKRSKPKFLSRASTIDAFINNRQDGTSCGFDSIQINDFQSRVFRPWVELHGSKRRVALGHNMNALFPFVPYIAATNPAESLYYPWVPDVKLISPSMPVCDPISQPDINYNKITLKWPTSESDYHWQPVFSSEIALSSATVSLLNLINNQNNVNSFSIAINDSTNFDYRDYPDDGNTQFKEKQNNVKLRNYIGLPHLSQAYYHWANQLTENVATELGSKTLGLYAYMHVVEPPDFPLNKNIVPNITHDLLMPIPKLDSGDSLLEAWAWNRKNGDLGWYDYQFDDPYLVPRIQLETTQNQLQLLLNNKVKHYYNEFHFNWANAPKDYILLKQLWDPCVDPYVLLKDWCYSAVSPQISTTENNGPGFMLYKYYRFWSDYWDHRVAKTEWYKRTNSTYLPYYKPNYMDALTWEDLDLVKSYLEPLNNTQKKPNTDNFYSAQDPVAIRKKSLYEANQFYLLSIENWLLQRDIFQEHTSISDVSFYFNEIVKLDGARQNSLKPFECDPVFQQRVPYYTFPDLVQFENHNLWALFDFIKNDTTIRQMFEQLLGDNERTLALQEDVKAIHSIYQHSEMMPTVTKILKDQRENSFESDTTESWDFWSRNRGVGAWGKSGIDGNEYHSGNKSFRFKNEVDAGTLYKIVKKDNNPDFFTGSGFYAIHGYVKIPEFQNAEGRTVSMAVEAHDIGNNAVLKAIKEITPRGTGWISVGVCLQMDPKVLQSDQITTLQFFVTVNGMQCDEILYLDDVDIYRIDQPSITVINQNNTSFETNILMPWNFRAENRPIGDLGESGLDTSEHKFEKQSFRFQNETGKATLSYVATKSSNPELFIGNGLYLAKAFIKAQIAQANQKVTLRIECTNAEEQLLFSSSRTLTEFEPGWNPMQLSLQMDPLVLQSEYAQNLRVLITTEDLTSDDLVFVDDVSFYKTNQTAIELLNPDRTSFENNELEPWSFWRRDSAAGNSGIDLTEHRTGSQSYRFDSETDTATLYRVFYKTSSPEYFEGSGFFTISGYAKVPAGQTSGTKALIFLVECNDKLNFPIVIKTLELKQLSSDWQFFKLDFQIDPLILQSEQSKTLQFHVNAKNMLNGEKYYLDDIAIYRTGLPALSVLNQTNTSFEPAEIAPWVYWSEDSSSNEFGASGLDTLKQHSGKQSFRFKSISLPASLNFQVEKNDHPEFFCGSGLYEASAYIKIDVPTASNAKSVTLIIESNDRDGNLLTQELKTISSKANIWTPLTIRMKLDPTVVQSEQVGSLSVRLLTAGLTQDEAVYVDDLSFYRINQSAVQAINFDNTSFETQELVFWHLWTQARQDYTLGACGMDTSEHRTGNQSFRIESEDRTAVLFYEIYKTRNPEYFNGSGKFHATAYVKIPEGQPTQGRTFSLSIEVHDNRNFPVVTKEITITPSSSDWTPVSLDFEIDPLLLQSERAPYLDFFLITNGLGLQEKIYIDDVSFFQEE